MAHAKSVAEIYKSVVNDVIEGVKYAFMDDSVDDQVLQELKQLWEGKLMQSKAVEPVEHEGVYSRPTAAGSFPLTTVQIKQQPQQQQQQQQQQPQPTMATQLLPSAAAASAASIQQQQQPINVPGQVLIAPAHQLGNSAQTSTITLPVPTGAFQQHLASLQYLVPSQPGQYVIQTAAGPRIIQSSQPLPGAVLAVATPSTTATAGQTITAKAVNQPVIQLDGLNDSSSDDDEEEEEEDEEQNEESEEPQGVEEDPLNSDDDISDTDPTEVFDAENVVVCQFDKINRSKNKWKFHLKDGIMNLNGRDYVFQKAHGDAEW